MPSKVRTDEHSLGELPNRVETAQVEHIARNARLDVLGGPLWGLVVCFLFSGMVPEFGSVELEKLATWYAAMLLWAAGLLITLSKFKRGSITAANTSNWVLAFVILYALNGLIWSAFVWLSWIPESVLNQITLSAIVFGLAIVLISQQSHEYRVFLSVTLPPFTIVVVLFLAYSDTSGLYFGPIVFFFGAFVLLVGRRANRVLAKSLEVGFENEALAQELKTAHDRVSETNTELRIVGELLEDAFESIPAGLAFFDADDRLVLVNSKQRDIFGSIADLMVPGASYQELLRAQQARGQFALDEVGRDNMLRDRMQQRRNPIGEVEQEFADGRVFLLLESRTRTGGIISVRTDVTEHRALEAHLHQAQKMQAVGQLTGGIAHEFNNLLQVVAGNLDILAETVPANDDTERQLQTLRKTVTRGSELTDRLLSFSRQQMLAPKAVEIGGVLADMQSVLSPALGEMIEIGIDVVPDAWPAEADPGQLENALLNLALNARDAMPDGGLITLSAANVHLDEDAAAMHEEATPGDYVKISVTDNGNGMTEEDQQHAFEPFFTTRDIGKGTGLGLSMVYGFAQQSGGFAEIVSQSGEGTTVHLYLPRLEGMATVAKGEDADETLLSGEGTILLVEDDADVQQAFAFQLTSLGYDLIEAQNGADALAIVESGRSFDLLFTDIVMPGGLSGIDLAQRLRQLQPDLKVIFTTGYSDEIVAGSGPLEDDAIVLRKPCDKNQLSAALSQVLD